MLKRGQISSQVLVYLLTLVIVGTILIIGYRYFTSSKKIIDKGEILQFQNKLISDMKSVGKDYGRYKKVSYSMPQNLEEVCFVELSKKDEVLNSKIIDFYPLIKDSLTSSLNKNIFFVGSDEQHSYYVDNIQINHYPFMSCFHRKNNKVNMGIEGLGGGNSVILADFVTKVNINPEDNTILHSADEIITVEVPKGTEVSSSYITIEMIEPTSEDTKKGASDVYKFGPVGTTFNPSVELRTKYNPVIMGDCPSQLTFKQFSEDGSQERTITSKSIDCQNTLAIFDITSFI